MNQHCCEEMNLHLSASEVAIVYLPEFREYGLKILDGGSSFQEIHYCPWCGQKLPESWRSRWFELMAELGLEWDDECIPPKYLSEAWWRDIEEDAFLASSKELKQILIQAQQELPSTHWEMELAAL